MQIFDVITCSFSYFGWINIFDFQLASVATHTLLLYLLSITLIFRYKLDLVHQKQPLLKAKPLMRIHNLIVKRPDKEPGGLNFSLHMHPNYGFSSFTLL